MVHESGSGPLMPHEAFGREWYSTGNRGLTRKKTYGPSPSLPDISVQFNVTEHMRFSNRLHHMPPCSPRAVPLALVGRISRHGVNQREKTKELASLVHGKLFLLRNFLVYHLEISTCE